MSECYSIHILISQIKFVTETEFFSQILKQYSPRETEVLLSNSSGAILYVESNCKATVTCPQK